MNEENVITTNEMDQEERMPFFRIPKAILTNEKYVGLFFASPFWRKLQNIFGECCIAKMAKVATG